jgi:hypothetical protein
MKELTHPILYLSGDGNAIKVSKKFIYNVEVYKVYKNGFNLVSNSYISINDNTNIKLRDISKSESGDTIIKSLELISAPEEYLIQNDYIKYEN